MCTSGVRVQWQLSEAQYMLTVHSHTRIRNGSCRKSNALRHATAPTRASLSHRQACVGGDQTDRPTTMELPARVEAQRLMQQWAGRVVDGSPLVLSIRYRELRELGY